MVYPRACGGARQLSEGDMNQEEHLYPARAGEPGQARCSPFHSKAYPRACGGAGRLEPARPNMSYLSPRVRGSQWEVKPMLRLRGSIPARAGQPIGEVGCTWPLTVYPRTRGATPLPRPASLSAVGLSPHARGNLYSLRLLSHWHRSIPARAGQPVNRLTKVGSLWVYPRTRGATVAHRSHCREFLGLSPHARGNHYLP